MDSFPRPTCRLQSSFWSQSVTLSSRSSARCGSHCVYRWFGGGSAPLSAAVWIHSLSNTLVHNQWTEVVPLCFGGSLVSLLPGPADLPDLYLGLLSSRSAVVRLLQETCGPVCLLLLLCCALTGLDALEADTSDKMPPTDAPVEGQNAEQDAAPSAAASAEPGPREEQQRPAGRDAPAAGAEGRVERPTAEPLEDELDNQENIISQVSDMCPLETSHLSPNFIQKTQTVFN